MTQRALQAIYRMPVSDRLRLVQNVLDSIADEQAGVVLTAEDKALIDRRIAAHRRAPRSGLTWEQVRRNMKSAR